MATPSTPECWLRGPVDGVHPALHAGRARLPADARGRREGGRGPDEEQLWLSPGGAASIGFHLHASRRQHRSAPDLRARRDAERRAEGGVQGGIATRSGDVTAHCWPVSGRSFDAAMAQLRATPRSVTLRRARRRPRGVADDRPRPTLPRRRALAAPCRTGRDDGQESWLTRASTTLRHYLVLRNGQPHRSARRHRARPPQGRRPRAVRSRSTTACWDSRSRSAWATPRRF